MRTHPAYIRACQRIDQIKRELDTIRSRIRSIVYQLKNTKGAL